MHIGKKEAKTLGITVDNRPAYVQKQEVHRLVEAYTQAERARKAEVRKADEEAKRNATFRLMQKGNR